MAYPGTRARSTAFAASSLAPREHPEKHTGIIKRNLQVRSIRSMPTGVVSGAEAISSLRNEAVIHAFLRSPHQGDRRVTAQDSRHRSQRFG
jgi:hypothetical protein